MSDIIFDFPNVPIKQQLFYVPGAAIDGGITTGGVRVMSPEPGGFGRLKLKPALSINQWGNPWFSWLTSHANGQLIKIQLGLTPQILTARADMSGENTLVKTFAANALKGSTSVSINFGSANFSLVAISNVSVIGNTVTKISGGSDWNGKAYILENSNRGSFISARITNGGQGIGLTIDPLSNNSFDTVDYWLHTSLDSNIYVYRNGLPITSFGTWSINDVIAVKCDGITVKYYKNTILLYSHPVNTPYEYLYGVINLSEVDISKPVADIKFFANGVNGQYLQKGHLLGHDIFCYHVDDISWYENLATIKVSPPLRKDISLGEAVLFRPYFVGMIKNGDEISEPYDSINVGHVDVPMIIFDEVIPDV